MSNEIGITFEAIAIKDNVGYASDYDLNSLYEVNIETGKCTFLTIFDEEPINRKRIHSCLKWIENKIYCIPGSGNKISVFNINSKTVKSISIPLPSKNKYAFYNEHYKFIDAVEYRGFLWLLPSTYPGILKLDMQTDEIEVFDKWITDTKFFFRAKSCLRGNKIIIPNGSSNEVLIFDVEEKRGKLKKIGTKNNGIMSICRDGENYWLAPRIPGAIICWNLLTNTIMEYENYPKNFEPEKIVFSNIFKYGESIRLSPASANEGLVFCRGELKIEEDIEWKKLSKNMVQYLFQTKKHYYYRELFSNNENRYFKISKSDNKLSMYKFYHNDINEKKKIISEKLMSQKELIKENSIFKLQDLIEKITNNN